MSNQNPIQVAGSGSEPEIGKDMGSSAQADLPHVFRIPRPLVLCHPVSLFATVAIFLHASIRRIFSLVQPLTIRRTQPARVECQTEGGIGRCFIPIGFSKGNTLLGLAYDQWMCY